MPKTTSSRMRFICGAHEAMGKELPAPKFFAASIMTELDGGSLQRM